MQKIRGMGGTSDASHGWSREGRMQEVLSKWLIELKDTFFFFAKGTPELLNDAKCTYHLSRKLEENAPKSFHISQITSRHNSQLQRPGPFGWLGISHVHFAVISGEAAIFEGSMNPKLSVARWTSWNKDTAKHQSVSPSMLNQHCSKLASQRLVRFFLETVMQDLYCK